MKFIALILGLLLLIAVVIFYLATPDSNQDSGSQVHSTASKSAKASSRSQQRAGEAIQLKSSEGPSGDRAMSDTDRRLAGVSALLTPIQVELVDSRMRTREPRYRALFDSWHLTSESADKILEIIRERETKCLQLNLKSYEKGARAMVETNKKKAVEREMAELMLIPLLGPDRYEELVRLEDQLKAESRQRGQAMIDEGIKRAEENGR